jgi:hypothetical protein
MSPSTISDPVERRLRSFAAFVVAIGVAVAVLGVLPGEREYVEELTCMKGPSNCIPHDVLVDKQRAGGLALWIPLALALAPAYAIARRPERRAAWTWFGWAATCAAIGGVLAVRELIAERYTYNHIEQLWPRHGVAMGMTALAAMFLVVLPAILLATRPPPSVPDARVV